MPHEPASLVAAHTAPWHERLQGPLPGYGQAVVEAGCFRCPVRPQGSAVDRTIQGDKGWPDLLVELVVDR